MAEAPDEPAVRLSTSQGHVVRKHLRLKLSHLAMHSARSQTPQQPYGATSEAPPEDESCAVCLSPLAGRSTPLTTSCAHAFHRQCLARLREHDASSGPSCCPVCRSQLEPGLTPRHALLTSRIGAARSAVALAQHARNTSQPSAHFLPSLSDAAFDEPDE